MVCSAIGLDSAEVSVCDDQLAHCDAAVDIHPKIFGSSERGSAKRSCVYRLFGAVVCWTITGFYRRVHPLELGGSERFQRCAFSADEDSAFAAEIDVDSARVLKFAYEFGIQRHTGTRHLAQLFRSVGIESSQHPRRRIRSLASRLSALKYQDGKAGAAQCDRH